MTDEAEDFPLALPRLFEAANRSKVVFRDRDGSVKQIVFDNRPQDADVAMQLIGAGLYPRVDGNSTLQFDV